MGWARRSAAPAFGAVLLMLAVAACGSEASSPSAIRAPSLQVSSTPGALPVRVVSVSATLEPYNPMLAHAGIPAEQVTFTVGGVYPHGYSCTIEVRRGRLIVGRSTMTGGSAAKSVESPVQIKGPTFSGSPKDAVVDCVPS
jgi:hypothetical protein